MTDVGGGVTDRYGYDAFGYQVNELGFTNNAYLFAGERLDGIVGLYFLRARYIDPKGGRFSTADIFLSAETMTPEDPA